MTPQQRLAVLKEYANGGVVTYRAYLEVTDAPDDLSKQLVLDAYLDVMKREDVREALSIRFRELVERELTKHRRDVN